MPNSTLSPSTQAQLRSLGISPEKHNSEDLRNLLPSFDGIEEISDLEILAEIIIYLSRHRIVSPERNSWKSLPWGAHACFFYKSSSELSEPFKNYFREGLLNNEKCIWIVPKSYGWENAERLVRELLTETGLDGSAFEIIRHENWYEGAGGRFRGTNEVVLGWLEKIESAVSAGFGGVRVAGDAHFHPEDLKKFFAYEKEVNDSIGTLKIKALCSYCIPNFSADQISEILNTHENIFGDCAIFGH